MNILAHILRINASLSHENSNIFFVYLLLTFAYFLTLLIVTCSETVILIFKIICKP